MSDINLRGATLEGEAPQDAPEAVDFRGAEPVEMAEPGILTSAKRGWQQSTAGAEARNMANLAEEWGRLQADTSPAAEKRKQEILGGIGTSRDRLREAASKMQFLPKSEGQQQFEDAKGWVEPLKQFGKHPWDVTTGVVAESLGSQGKTLPLQAAAGVVGGPAALAFTTGVASMAQEYDSGILELLSGMNVNLDDPVAIAQAMTSPAFKNAKIDKLRKAAVVGAFDSLTASTVGMKMGKTPVKNIAAQTGVQMAGGGAGEAAGSVAAGEEIKPSAVYAEMIGEIPGGVKDVAINQLHNLLKSHTISRAADEAQREAETGLNTEEQKTVDTVVGAATKQHLNPLQSRIALAAIERGLDPQAVLAIVGIESGFKPDAKNPKSTAHGLFQQLDATWNESGGGDRNDVNQQIANGLAGLAATKAAMEKRLGREISPEQLYYGHLLGPRGGTALAIADSMDPQGSFLDTVKSYDPKNAEAILRNNGLWGLTNEQAARKIDAMVAKKSMALGGNEALNSKTKAGPVVDSSPAENVNPAVAEDEALGLTDLDQMFRDIDEQGLTPQDVEAAKAEEVVAQAEAGADPQHLTELAAVDELPGDQPQGARLDETMPRLPRELAGATPKYGFANRLFAVDFASDVDRAAYIIANENKKSSRDGDFLKFVMENLGIDEAGARAYGKEVRARVKELAREARADDTVTTLKMAEAKRAESWVSLDEQDTRERYTNPNDKYAGMLSKAPVVAAPDGNEGMTLGERSMQPGEVVAVGEDSHHTPAEYMRAVQQTLQNVISRFAPAARVVLTFQTEKTGTVSSQQAMGGIGRMRSRKSGLGLYKVNMRNATGLGNEATGGTQNPTTQRKITYAAYHEAGHVIVDEQMLQGMTPELRNKFKNLGVDEYFTEEDLAQLPADQAQVLREFNELKWKTLNDPSFTARDFANAWFSPWKLGHGHGANQGLFSFVRNFMGQGWVQQLDGPAGAFARAMDLQLNGEGLKPHEYLAEQFARYAYATGMAEASPLAQSFFARALATLRAFFRELKGAGAVKPGVAFAEWMDSFTAAHEEVVMQREAPKAAAAERKAKPRVKAKTKAAPAPVVVDEPSLLPPVFTPQQERNLEVVRGGRYDAKQQANFNLLANNLAFVADEDPTVYKYWSDLIEKGRLEDFRNDVAEYIDEDFANENVRYDTDTPEAAEWKDIVTTLDKPLKRAGLGKWLPRGLSNLSAAKYFAMTLEQMAMRFPEVAGLQALAMMKNNYKAFKAKLEFHGLEAAQKWSKLGKEQHGLLERAMRDEHASGEHFAELTKVNGVYRFVPNETLIEYARKHGLDEDTVQVWLDTKNAHVMHMNALQNVLARKMMARYKKRPATLKVKLHDLAQQFQVIRSTPFLPQTRFGQYAIHVLEKSGTEGGSVPVHIEFFESAAMRDEALTRIKGAIAKNPRLTVQPAYYKATSAILRTLPPQVLTTFSQELDLTPQERQELKEIADSLTRSPQLRKYSLQLAQITGANKDLLRNFSDFMWHSANNIAKTTYREHMKKAVLQIEADMQDAAHDGDVAWHDELVRIRQFAADYMDHMMSPVDEWQKVRAFVVYKQLWFNVRSAVMNLGSLHSIWALAARQEGNIKGTARSNEAIAKVAADGFARVANRVLRRPVEGASVFSADTQWAVTQAREDGLLDESFAAQLANFANSGTLSRLNFQRGDSIVKKVLWLGMQPQHLVERFVREVGLVTHFEHYKRQGLSNSEAYMKARTDVIATQGDNSLLNRPEFMRGKYSKFLIYYGFMQQQLYLFSGAQERARNFKEAYLAGETAGMSRADARAKFFSTKMGGETLKMWMAYLFLGGLMGMPGAEDLDNIMEMIAKKFFGTHFSLKEYAYKLAHTISEEASAFGVDINPRSIVHGTFADFGIPWIGPKIDVSNSMGLGSPLPGGGALAAKDANEGVVKLMGPLGGALRDVWQGAFGDDPNKRFGLLPTGVKGFVQTIADWDKGVTASNGGKITIDRKTGAVRDLTTGEKIMQLMNFTPEIVAANKEIHWMQKDVETYWTSRRNQLVSQVAEAKLQGDREAMADALDALAKFNEQAPGKLAVKSGELWKSLRRKQKAALQTERGLGRNKRFREIEADIRDDVEGD